jgi:PAS domain S-box-containing protein
MAATIPEGWAGLFSTAFRQSRNGMVLVDDARRHVDANGAYLKLLGRRKDAVLGRPVWDFVADGPVMSRREWAAALAVKSFTGEAVLIAADGSRVGVQWGATTEVVTGRRLVLVVALSTSRWGRRFRRDVDEDAPVAALSKREREIVRLVAAGSTGPEIADELRLAPDTVRTHVRNAMTKTGARSRAHLVAKAIGDALMEP